MKTLYASILPVSVEFDTAAKKSVVVSSRFERFVFDFLKRPETGPAFKKWFSGFCEGSARAPLVLAVRDGVVVKVMNI